MYVQYLIAFCDSHKITLKNSYAGEYVNKIISPSQIKLPTAPVFRRYATETTLDLMPLSDLFLF